jgi:hypothetical protein
MYLPKELPFQLLLIAESLLLDGNSIIKTLQALLLTTSSYLTTSSDMAEALNKNKGKPTTIECHLVNTPLIIEFIPILHRPKS